MNWTWTIRARDGGMNGLEFTRATTAGDFSRVLVHSAPAQMSVEVIDDDRKLIAAGDVDRDGDYSPMTLLELVDGEVRRTEVWPTAEHHGMLVLLAGGEVGALQRWEHGEDRDWWRWSVEFSNHTGRPDDWHPDGQRLQR